MALYETAFDSTVTPSSDPDDDPERDPLEASRRMCSPDPPSQRPSPASSRSSTDSAGNRRNNRRSPALPLKKLFSPWVCGKSDKCSDTPTEPTPSVNMSTEQNTSKTFSPSVEFKKLDVADEKMLNLNECFSAKTPCQTSSSNKDFLNQNTSIKEVTPSINKNVGLDNNHYYSNMSAHRTFEREQNESESRNLNETENTFQLSRHSRDGAKRCSLELNLSPNINCDSEFKIPSEQTTSAKFQLPKSSREDMKRSNLDSSGLRNNLWLDFSRAPKRQRRHLCLDIPEVGEQTEPTAYLLKQEWYHGSISRADAENLLRLMKKGSFLVRCSEKLKRQYLLSLKSSRGVMHVKIIQLPNGKYVIKQQTQTFDSIPQLIQYFSTHILNIHEMNVYLSHPVIEKLL
ncbi:hypothetical protein JTE90_014765 [Oedothorax gibbosus]|uniref:SH2 domain-containing protein n=1 Tax=Oedothorax gibbosus TaxID=931172 RepID=A0AAV6US76_9ARAC|nr:hypothetical protein JTE90_014765 [Oedothorax gibbosus]